MMKYLMALVMMLLVPATAMAKGECKADQEKFCSDVTAKADVKACLKKHEAELSEPCKAKREAKQRQRGQDSGKTGESKGEGAAEAGKAESSQGDSSKADQPADKQARPSSETKP